MLTLLRAHGLEDYVDSAMSKVATDLKKKALAMHAITRNIEQDQLLNIISFDNDPLGAWEALREEHAGDTSQDIATMTIELNRKRLDPNPSEEEVVKHFAEMVTLSNRLKTADKTRALTDADFATKLLLSLPEEFE